MATLPFVPANLSKLLLSKLIRTQNKKENRKLLDAGTILFAEEK